MEHEHVDDPLDWTITPKTSLIKEKYSRCFITTPQQRFCNDRVHPLHLMREVDIEPDKRHDLQKQDSAFARHIVKVHEKDLHRCGTDLEMLRKCALPPVETDAKHKLHEKGNKKSKSLSSFSKVTGDPRRRACPRETERPQTAHLGERRLSRTVSVPKTGPSTSQAGLIGLRPLHRAESCEKTFGPCKSASSLRALRHETAFVSNGASNNLKLSHPHAPRSPAKVALDALLNVSRQANGFATMSSKAALPFLLCDTLSETLSPPKLSKSSNSSATMQKT